MRVLTLAIFLCRFYIEFQISLHFLNIVIILAFLYGKSFDYDLSVAVTFGEGGAASNSETRRKGTINHYFLLLCVFIPYRLDFHFIPSTHFLPLLSTFPPLQRRNLPPKEEAKRYALNRLCKMGKQVCLDFFLLENRPPKRDGETSFILRICRVPLNLRFHKRTVLRFRFSCRFCL